MAFNPGGLPLGSDSVRIRSDPLTYNAYGLTGGSPWDPTSSGSNSDRPRVTPNAWSTTREQRPARRQPAVPVGPLMPCFNHSPGAPVCPPAE
jgi:hypothetical protein